MTSSSTTPDCEVTEPWMTCAHRFNSWFGPVLKCGRCGATTIVSMDPKESKPIFPPVKYVEETDG